MSGRQIQKIIQIGNSSAVTIPRAALFWLGWLPGQRIVLEVTEDKRVVIRLPEPDELAPKRAPAVQLDPFPRPTL